jgi:transcriptional regulator with XRE-family HTH domain
MYSVGMPTGSKEQPDAFNEALMKVIRAKMGIMQLNIADLARLTDIPRSTLSRIINSKRQPELNQIRLIAIALGIPMAQLMGAADDILAGKDPFIT